LPPQNAAKPRLSLNLNLNLNKGQNQNTTVIIDITTRVARSQGKPGETRATAKDEGIRGHSQQPARPQVSDL